MKRVDLILLHPPSIYRFRERPVFHGPISDVIPSSSIFENYPIGFLTLSEYLNRRGVSVRIVNLALKMLRDATFDPEGFIARLDPVAFGIDLHWLPHVDGSLCLAEVVKRYHPRTPVILGGLSATYFHREIMQDYPFVDFVVCGDSTEEPLRLLMEAIRTGGDFGTVPNLVWRDRTGETVVNGISYRPTSLDYVSFDYAHPVKMTLKYHDPSGYLPFRNWLANPVMAAFSCRGCRHDCASCGGSASAFRTLGGRERPVFRSPELLARDIRDIARYTGAPVMVVGDLLQAGEEYAGKFLQAMKKYRVENELAIEFFQPPAPPFVEQVADCLTNFNVEISPESHDPRVRRAFGKAYDNDELEAAIEAFVRSSCRRLDLFFMVGLPFQDYSSVMATVEYCGELLRRYGAAKKLLPMIAPLAPFVDPGSRIFEEPQRFGYRLFYRTLREHRQAMLMPTWKQRLNYETDWMTRDEIVRATYDAALRLIELKAEHGLLGTREAAEIGQHIRMARELITRIEEAPALDASLREEIARVNR
ncbi:MAG TPA: TIGR04190 family B12-binding domain/radical SAM domain protein, partial [Geobacteraceae bacterium]